MCLNYSHYPDWRTQLRKLLIPVHLKPFPYVSFHSLKTLMLQSLGQTQTHPQKYSNADVNVANTRSHFTSLTCAFELQWCLCMFTCLLAYEATISFRLVELRHYMMTQCLNEYLHLTSVFRNRHITCHHTLNLLKSCFP